MKNELFWKGCIVFGLGLGSTTAGQSLLHIERGIKAQVKTEIGTHLVLSPNESVAAAGESLEKIGQQENRQLKWPKTRNYMLMGLSGIIFGTGVGGLLANRRKPIESNQPINPISQA